MKNKIICVPVYGFPKYMVSNFGQVKNKKTGRILKVSINKENGYAYFCLTGIKSRQWSKSAHRLVLMSFNPTNDLNLECDHIDGDKTNNALANLQWLTRSENAKKIYKDGRKKKKGKRLSFDDVKFIFDNCIKGNMSRNQCAKKISTTRSNIKHVVRGRTHKKTIKELKNKSKSMGSFL